MRISRHQGLGVLSAGGLCVHSFLDGVAIGAGFQTTAKLGFLIALGIIAHDLSDGLNTVTVVLAHGNPRRRALFWLVIDMLAPVVGSATSLFVNLDGMLPLVLAFFAGSFLYIGASDLLPEAKVHDSLLVGLATVSGDAGDFRHDSVGALKIRLIMGKPLRKIGMDQNVVRRLALC
jgi:zinc transporter, ZIP family